jgi:membrane protein implicated in regulation of membrane protease activity
VTNGDPNDWRWIWIIAMVVFGVGEMGVAGSFFLAPFAIGAGVAAALAFAGVSLGIEWAAFLVVSILFFVALRPIARRLDAEGPALGVGSSRQIGQRARVTEAIEGEHDHGTVVVGRETWRAESLGGVPIDVGATVIVESVRGTRVVVRPIRPTDDPPEDPSAP